MKIRRTVAAWRIASWVLAAALAALYFARHRVEAGTQWLLVLQHVGFNAALCLGFGRTLASDSKPLVSRILVIPRAERGGFFQSVAAYRQFARGEAAKQT